MRQKWRSGGVAEWRSGGVAEWRSVLRRREVFVRCLFTLPLDHFATSPLLAFQLLPLRIWSSPAGNGYVGKTPVWPKRHMAGAV